MVTIQNLEVRFDVEGEGDEAVFTRYFQKYIKQWKRLEDEAQSRQRVADCERSLGDRPAEDSQWR